MGSVVGGLFGGGEEPSTSVSRDIPGWLQPTIKDMVSRADTLSQQGYIPYTGQRVQDFSDDQMAAFQGVRDLIGGYQPYLDQAQQTTSQIVDRAMSGPTAGQIQGLMNPYQQNVIDLEKQKAIEGFDTTLQSINDRATQAGSFGGSRHAILESEAYDNIANQLGDIQTRGSQQAYNQAMNQFNTGTQMAGQAASQQAGLAGQAQNLGLQGLQALLGTGGQQQALGQQQLDVAYQDFLKEQQHPYDQLNFLSGITGPILGATVGETSTQDSGSGSGLGNILGAAASIASIASGLPFSFADGGYINAPPIGSMTARHNAMFEQMRRKQAEEDAQIAQSLEGLQAFADRNVLKEEDINWGDKSGKGNEISEGPRTEFLEEDITWLPEGQTFADGGIIDGLANLISRTGYGYNPQPQSSTPDLMDYLKSIDYSIGPILLNDEDRAAYARGEIEPFMERSDRTRQRAAEEAVGDAERAAVQHLVPGHEFKNPNLAPPISQVQNVTEVAEAVPVQNYPAPIQKALAKNPEPRGIARVLNYRAPAVDGIGGGLSSILGGGSVAPSYEEMTSNAKDSRRAEETGANRGINVPLLRAGLAMLSTPGSFGKQIAAGGNAYLDEKERIELKKQQTAAAKAKAEQQKFENRLAQQKADAYTQQVKTQAKATEMKAKIDQKKLEAQGLKKSEAIQIVKAAQTAADKFREGQGVLADEAQVRAVYEKTLSQLLQGLGTFTDFKMPTAAASDPLTGIAPADIMTAKDVNTAPPPLPKTMPPAKDASDAEIKAWLESWTP